MSLLEVDEIGVRFGGVVALDGLTFTIADHEICALIGPNGAGKTTLFNVVSRLYDPDRGTLRFAGQDLLSMAPRQIAPLGIARTFQNLALVPGLTVIENVMIGAHCRTTGGFVEGLLGFTTVGRERRARAEAAELLDRLSLGAVASQPAAGLPYGTLKRIELARALAAKPRLLMLDEPASGLTHAEVAELGSTIRSLRDDFDLTVLLVEHHMGMVMGISEHVVVMEFGQKIADGTPAEVQHDQRVIQAYLGERRMSLLSVRELRAGYGPIQVLNGIDLDVEDGEIVVVLGANGSGKTTTLRALSGMIPARGELRFADTSVLGRRPDDLVRLGMAHVPQGRGTFPELTVAENLRVGGFTRPADEVAGDIEEWFVTFPRLGDRREQLAGSMSGGEQQMLAIARALMSRPRLLLLDEPSLGLAPLVTRELFDYIARVNAERGTTTLVVEQNANLALDIAHRGYVLETGSIVLSGTADELRGDDAVRRAYLGV